MPVRSDIIIMVALVGHMIAETFHGRVAAGWALCGVCAFGL
jgi:hypothetical protein